MAQLLAKFRIDFSDVIIIPDVTKKADPATKAEFEELISGCDIDTGELNSEREKTNRYYAILYKSISRVFFRENFVKSISHFRNAYNFFYFFANNTS